MMQKLTCTLLLLSLLSGCQTLQQKQLNTGSAGGIEPYLEHINGPNVYALLEDTGNGYEFTTFTLQNNYSLYSPWVNLNTGEPVFSTQSVHCYGIGKYHWAEERHYKGELSKRVCPTSNLFRSKALREDNVGEMAGMALVGALTFGFGLLSADVSYMYEFDADDYKEAITDAANKLDRGSIIQAAKAHRNTIDSYVQELVDEATRKANQIYENLAIVTKNNTPIAHSGVQKGLIEVSHIIPTALYAKEFKKFSDLKTYEDREKTRLKDESKIKISCEPVSGWQVSISNCDKDWALEEDLAPLKVMYTLNSNDARQSRLKREHEKRLRIAHAKVMLNDNNIGSKVCIKGPGKYPAFNGRSQLNLRSHSSVWIGGYIERIANNKMQIRIATWGVDSGEVTYQVQHVNHVNTQGIYYDKGGIEWVSPENWYMCEF